MLSLQGYSAKCDRIFESLVNKAIKEKYPEKQRVDLRALRSSRRGWLGWALPKEPWRG